MNIDYSKIGERIQDKRREKHLTQAFLAEKMNVSVGYISQVERGITKISLDLLAAISTYLECDVSDFVSEAQNNSKLYLSNEFNSLFLELNSKEKKTIMEMMKILLQNR